MLARTYAALPFEYLDTLAALSDAQFGKLMRWLLRYAAAGEYGELSGQAAIFREVVRVNEDRFRDSYEAIEKRRSEAGKRGAQIRWSKPPESPITPAEPPITQAAPSMTSPDAEFNRRRDEAMRRLMEADGK